MSTFFNKEEIFLLKERRSWENLTYILLFFLENFVPFVKMRVSTHNFLIHCHLEYLCYVGKITACNISKLNIQEGGLDDWTVSKKCLFIVLPYSEASLEGERALWCRYDVAWFVIYMSGICYAQITLYESKTLMTASAYAVRSTE